MERRRSGGGGRGRGLLRLLLRCLARSFPPPMPWLPATPLLLLPPPPLLSPVLCRKGIAGTSRMSARQSSPR